MTRPLPRRVLLVIATLAATTLAACSSPTAPSSNTDAERGGTYGGSSTKLCGGTYGGSSTC